MSINVNFNPALNMVNLSQDNVLTFNTAEQALIKLLQGCQQNWSWLILWDITESKYKINSEELFALSELISVTFPNHCRMAWLTKEEQIPDEFIHLLNMTNKAHKFDFEIFDDKTQALSWLQSTISNKAIAQ